MKSTLEELRLERDQFAELAFTSTKTEEERYLLGLPSKEEATELWLEVHREYNKLKGGS